MKRTFIIFLSVCVLLVSVALTHPSAFVQAKEIVGSGVMIVNGCEIDIDNWGNATVTKYHPEYGPDVVIPSSVNYSDSTGMVRRAVVTTIGKGAFKNCTSLKSVMLNDGLKLIGEEAFYSCTGLKSLIVPDSVTDICADAFRSCTALYSVTIPASVTTIAGGAFSHCKALTDVVFDEASKAYLGSIGTGVFFDCRSLKSIVIPRGVSFEKKTLSFGFYGNNPDTDRIPGFTIYSYRNTYAKRYADYWGFHFVDLEENPILPTEGPGEETQSVIKIHLRNDAGRIKKPYLWLWYSTKDGNSIDAFSSWPGEKMTVGSDGWYTKEITVTNIDSYYYIISDIGDPQSADYGPINYQNHAEIWILIDDDVTPFGNWADYYDYNPLEEQPSEPVTQAPTQAPTQSPTQAPDDPPVQPTQPPTQAPTEPDVTIGDVDGDGVISVLDATRIQKFKAKLCNIDGAKYNGTEPTNAQKQIADVDKDGVISVLDATRIQKYKAKLCNLDGSTPYTG